MQEIFHTFSFRRGQEEEHLPLLKMLYPYSSYFVSCTPTHSFSFTPTYLFNTLHTGLLCLTLGLIGAEFQVRLVTDLNLSLGTRGRN